MDAAPGTDDVDYTDELDAMPPTAAEATARALLILSKGNQQHGHVAYASIFVPVLTKIGITDKRVLLPLSLAYGKALDVVMNCDSSGSFKIDSMERLIKLAAQHAT